jgi:hypothetical protein
LRRALLVGLLLSLLAACDQDPFGFSERRVAGDYRLNEWEDGLYYLVGGPTPDSGGGAINGTVLRLGWDSRYIIAQRQSMADGDTAWMVVDVARRSVTGPFTEQEIQARPELARLRTFRADSAWRKL